MTGENLDLLRQFLNLLTTRVYYDENDSAEFQIDDTYTVPGAAEGTPNALLCSARSARSGLFALLGTFYFLSHCGLKLTWLIH